MGKTVLLIGAAGYVGDFLTDLINDSLQETRVIVYDALYFNDFYFKKGFEFVRGDIRDRKKLKPYLDQADYVAILAGFVGDASSAISPAQTLDVNREAVKWIAENYSGRIAFLSSCSIYGSGEGLLTEESPPNPLSLYAISKLQAEKYLENGPNLILRLGTLHGISSQHSRPRLDLLVNRMSSDAFLNGKLRCNSGQQWRAFMHVKEIAKVIARDIRSNGKETGVFNLVTENATLFNVAQRIQKLLPRTKIETSDLPQEDLRNYKVSAEKARKLLHFYPTLTIEDGASEIISALKEGRIKDTKNPIYNNHEYFKKFKPYEDERFPAKQDLELEAKTLVLSSITS